MTNADVTGTLPTLRPRLFEAMAPLAPELRDAIIQSLIRELTIVAPPVRHARDRGVYPASLDGERYYAIQGREFGWLAEAASICGGLTSLFPGHLLLGTIAGVAVILFRYRRERIALDGEQALVISTLRKAPPAGWILDDLAVQLPLAHMKRDRLDDVLVALGTLRREDGKPIALVHNQAGRWHTVGL